MLLLLPGVIPRDRVDHLLSALETASYADGAETALGAAKAIKHNEQLTVAGEGGMALGKIVVEALYASAEVRAAALPQRILMPMFSRYRMGMAYGAHLDAPVLGKSPEQLRTDISVTAFLIDPATYEGGELILHVHGGRRAVKGKPGDVFIYPSDTLHEVTQVTRGERVVAVTWMQSMVRHPAQREILYDLRAQLGALQQRGVEPGETLQLQRVYNALMRMWAEP